MVANRTAKASIIRLSIGGALLLIALLVALFVFPDANDKRAQQQRAAQQANKIKGDEAKSLTALQKEVARIKDNRARIDGLLSTMSADSEATLKWKLRKALYELAAQHGIRLQSVKYGAVTRDGAKGTDLETIDVELVGSGVYKQIKGFVYGLEKSHLPFGISSGRLDEGQDGLRLTLSLRAFRRTGGANPAKKESA